MIPKITQIDTDHVTQGLRLVGVRETAPADRAPEKTPLDPELQAIFEASWKRNEAAYRYLGR